MRPEPGIYKNVPFDEYMLWEGCSNSMLNDMRQSPAHCYYRKRNPEEPTPAMILGSAVDALVFEPDSFKARFAVTEQCTAKTQKGSRCSNQGSLVAFNFDKECDEWFCGTHSQANSATAPSQRILSASDNDNAVAMSEAVRAHQSASQLLTACEAFQASMLWRDSHGLYCKGRPDGISKKHQVIIDLKTTIDAGPTSFTKTIFNLHYYAQAAMYLSGARSCGVDIQDFAFIAVEKTPPFGVAVYRLEESAIEFGRREIDRLLATYRDCIDHDSWPGYPSEIVDISLPEWVIRSL